jgi:hypothetical protein
VIIAFIAGVTISACVANNFPYFYYALDSQEYTGVLRGPTEANDIDMKECMPTERDKAPCTVMFTDVFLRLKEDYIKCQKSLIQAEKGF